MDELVIGEKRYVSSKRAAEITGYAKDYVGQLCREGYVEAKMVGRSWYVLETSIREHRFAGSNGTTTSDQKASSAKKADTDQEGNSGAVNAEGSVGTAQDAPQSPVLGWQRPTYMSEAPTPIPTIEARSEAPTAVQGRSGAFAEEYQKSEVTEGALSDMQAAWKEWFEQKQAIPEDDSEKKPSAGFDENENAPDEDEVDEKYQEKYTDVGNSDLEEEKDSYVDDDADEGFDIPIQRQKDAPSREDEYGEDQAVPEESFQDKEVQIPLRKMRAHEQGIIREERIVKPRKMGRAERRSTLAVSSVDSNRSSILFRAILIAIAGLVIAVAVVGSGLASTGTNPIVDYLGGTSKVNK